MLSFVILTISLEVYFGLFAIPNFLQRKKTKTLKTNAMQMPGKKPAMNCLPTEVFMATQIMIMGALGGIRTPSDPADVTTPKAIFFGYPASMSAGIMMLPIATTVARLDPVMAAKNAHEAIVAIARPPFTRPNTMFMRPMSLLAVSPWAATPPAKMKNGTARRTNLSRPPNSCWTIINGPTFEKKSTPTMVVVRTTIEIGRPRTRRTQKLMRMANAMVLLFLSL